MGPCGPVIALAVGNPLPGRGGWDALGARGPLPGRPNALAQVQGRRAPERTAGDWDDIGCTACGLLVRDRLELSGD
jgi:hypothetical protein